MSLSSGRYFSISVCFQLSGSGVGKCLGVINKNYGKINVGSQVNGDFCVAGSELNLAMILFV